MLALLCAVSAFCYAAFLLEAVGHTAARARAAHDLVDLRAKLGAVESTYLAAQQSLTPARAAALGLAAPKAVATVYAADPARVLTLAGVPLPSAQ